ncbi:MAG: adenine phosphoribosyltransferase, partial [Candidatus Thermoplasmatota archaeon]|nr:adenine phosphoribosyltransferase [Candidatus Thermoplasmatota archaeon]
MNSLGLLKKTLLDSPVINAGDDGSYQYFVHPITDGVPEVSKELLEEVAEAIIDVADLCCDKLVTVEAMGLLASLSLTLRTRIPTVVIRKRKYGLPGEVAVEQKTGYRNNQHLCINGLNRGDRIVFVDDVLSTGGTL